MNIDEAFDKWAKTEGEKIRVSEGGKYIRPWCEMGSYNFRPENWIRLKIGFTAGAESQSEVIAQLKRELYQQRFNNEHNLSIDQKVSDEIKGLKEDLKWALDQRRSLRFTREYSKDDMKAHELTKKHGLDV